MMYIRVDRQAWHGLCFTLFCFLAWPVAAQQPAASGPVTNPTAVWSAWGGAAEFKLKPLILADMGLAISVPERFKGGEARIVLPALNLGSLEFHAPQGQFDDFLNGTLGFEAPLTLVRNQRQVSMTRLFVEPHRGERFPSLQLRDDNGRILFIAKNIHVFTRPAEQRLVMERMDVTISEELAALLGEPAFAGIMIGELALGANLNIPAGAETEVRGGTCAERPKWPTQGFIADVGLTTMDDIQDVGTVVVGPDTFELVAPSSSLQNLQGLDGADVAWYRKFNGTFPPYNNDQHPYLIWNLYRVANGRLEQIGASGVKHAFLTINVGCTINCGDGGIPGASGHILWPGCEDTYGVGNNDSPSDIGPRAEINPRTGVFVSTGSFFDQNGDGVQDNGSNGLGENRLRVLRDDLLTPGAQYFFESWYVIRDDSNIFNSMGIRPVTPTNTSGDLWAYPFGTFVVGPAIDQWVPPATDPGTGNQNVTFQNADVGHLKLAVQSQDLGGGVWRYTYMLMNFDVERGISSLIIPVTGGVLSNVSIHDADHDPGNDWTFSSNGGQGLLFSAPAGNEIKWGTGYAFSFDIEDAPPVQRKVGVNFGPGVGPPNAAPTIVSPADPDLLLRDGFED